MSQVFNESIQVYGDLYVSGKNEFAGDVTFSKDINLDSGRLVLISSNGSKYKLVVSNDGILSLQNFDSSQTTNLSSIIGEFANNDVTTNTLAQSWNNYWVDTTLAPITITLPSFPTKGDRIRFFDVSSTFDTNNLIVDRNGQKIQGDADDLTVAIEGAAFELVYSGSTYGWRIFSV